MEVSQGVCSLYFTFVQHAQLGFYVRGSRFRNISLLLLSLFMLLLLLLFMLLPLLLSLFMPLSLLLLPLLFRVRTVTYSPSLGLSLTL